VPDLTARAVVDRLTALADPAQLPSLRNRLAPDEPAFGVRMKHLFDTAAAHAAMPLDQVHVLLDHEAYEPRMAAFCVLDVRARGNLDVAGRDELAQVYLDRHDRITTWDMVDRAAPRVLGRWLQGQDLAPLRQLAASDDPLRRRTAVTAPLWFARYGPDDDLRAGLAVAEPVAADRDPLVHKAVGILLGHAGARDPDAVRGFLDRHAASMARPAVRLATAKLPAADRNCW
jgi:hypothetical protein